MREERLVGIDLLNIHQYITISTDQFIDHFAESKKRKSDLHFKILIYTSNF